MELLADNEEWVVHNERYNEVIKIVHELFPELLKYNHWGEYMINYSLLRKALAGNVILDTQKFLNGEFPSFESLKNKAEFEAKDHLKKDSSNMYLKLNIMLEVAQLSQGKGIGELALVEDKPRNASII
jgi:hypothetical protein